jgi:hypothetical protein
MMVQHSIWSFLWLVLAVGIILISTLVVDRGTMEKEISTKEMSALPSREEHDMSKPNTKLHTLTVCYLDTSEEPLKYPRNPLDIIDPDKYGQGVSYPYHQGLGVFYLAYMNDCVEPLGYKFELESDPDVADLLVCDIWGDKRLPYRNKPTIQQGYESLILETIEEQKDNENLVFATSELRAGPHFYLPLSVAYYGFDFYQSLQQEGKFTQDHAKRKFCLCVVSNPVESYRKAFIEALHTKYKSVDCYGNLFKNIDSPIINESSWFDPRILSVISQYKFIIVMENRSQKGYHTEKLFHGFRAGVIPIYWGDTNVPLLYDSQGFVYIEPEEDIASAIEKVKVLDENDVLYLQMLNRPKLGKALQTELSCFTSKAYFGNMLVQRASGKPWSNPLKM